MKPLFLFLALFAFGFLPVHAQVQSVSYVTTDYHDTIFLQMMGIDTVYHMDEVEVPPKYPGGEPALTKYLATVEYPKKALKNKVEGTVVVSFLISEKGKVIATMVKTSSGDKTLDEAALNHINKMPLAWHPGRNSGEKVCVEYVLSVNFAIKE